MIKGYTFDKRRKSKPYKVQINVGKECVYFGYFDTPEEATEAYIRERAKNKPLPRSGGTKDLAKLNQRWQARKTCPNCNEERTEALFDRHYTACIRDYPLGRNPWTRVVYRKKRNKT